MCSGWRPAAIISLLNLSTRAWVGTGDDALIGGFIIDQYENREVTVRAIGPSLGVAAPSLAGQVLADPELTVFDVSGKVVAISDDWQEDVHATAIAPELRPNDPAEAAVAIQGLGLYAVVVRGVGDTTGLALFEVFDNGPPLAISLNVLSLPRVERDRFEITVLVQDGGNGPFTVSTLQTSGRPTSLSSVVPDDYPAFPPADAQEAFILEGTAPSLNVP